MINGYINWLQTLLGNKYLVTEEEKTDINPDINEVILSEFSGVNYQSCVVFTYQAMVLTNDVEETMHELQEFTWRHNNETLSTNEFPYIRNLMAQPVNISNFQEYNINYKGTITISITLIASLGLSDIKQILIDGELINPTQLTVGYQAVTETNRVNGEELNATDINESGLTVQVSMPLNNTTLLNKVTDITFGVLPKNSPFVMELTFSNNRKYTIEFKMLTNAINYERSSLTATSITLIK